MASWKNKMLSLGLSAAMTVSMLASIAGVASAATVTVGAGSYTNTLPAGATGPQSTIYKTSSVTGAVPTNDWWSSLAWKQYSDVMFPHPFGIQAKADGLGVSYPVQSASADAMFGAYSLDFTLGSSASSSFPDTRLDGYSDWTVSMLWNNGGGGTMRVTSGHGVPYLYATYAGGNPKLTFSSTPTVWSGSASSNVLGVTVNGHHYALFGATGTTWSGIGSATLTNNLGGKTYFSVAVLPDNTTATLNAFKTYAYSFITDTQTSYSYNASTSKVTTTYNVTTSAKEGTQTGTIFALYPHQWKNSSNSLLSYTYNSVRGTMKTLSGSSFSTTMTYQGILPYLPAVGSYNASTLNSQIEAVRTEANHTVGATDTYWLGKYLGRIANLLPIAQQAGNSAAVSNFESYLENTLSSNFNASGKSNNLFYYDGNWGTLIGYPASYGSDGELNDHHFHYGYWVRAAAEVARNNPTWASQSNWGGMVNLLIKDFANWDRTDTRFPYLRNFDPYAGHSWASGDSPFADGNNQESSSEAINAWEAMILWGQATGNTTIRDLGISLYTTEVNAINEYWFNTSGTNFKSGYNHNYSSMIWGGKSVYATWFSADPQAIRGINILPVTGASMYLGYNPTYSQSFINQLQTERGNNNWNMWPDIFWEYQALYDATGAIALYNANTGYTPEDGETKAHTYSFLYNMQALGQVDTSVTANVPTYGVFKKGSTRNYVAYNAGTSAITVTFSDGKTLSVPAGQIATSIGSTGSTAPAITSLSPTSGPVGTSVTISGSNFGSTQGSSTVKFGSTTATITSWSASSIVANVPTGLSAGSTNVTVTTSAGTSNTSAFTVTAASSPAISSLSPTSGPVGTSVTISGSNFGSTQGSSTVKFGSTTAAVTSWSASSIVATVPSGLAAGSANVTVTTSAGTSGAAAFTVTAVSGDFSVSITKSGSNAIFTFTPTASGVATTAPIIHFQSTALYGGAQQNVYMNAGSGGTWTYTVTGLSTGNVVKYSFTYNKNGIQQPESAQQTFTF
ncbi:IPT/TIG domain-containing protein [Paenibacillus athensensis]|uniref:glucan endo-1,3-beta-D-glucosidase n=1 Tax=Paenibacillus athensensis TaxID=1967502 RepID=A0A4Y8PTC0_9BACL|nr:glycosyl hydrolase [Paenibacillus athensensis]MCD1261292.1 IPT/TIG domain-containing protein [Paenibacillus athensensis]